MPSNDWVSPAVWALPDDARVLVASDMHLGDHDPRTADFFLDALTRTIHDYSHLLLLGDLFEAWAGDDTADAVAERAIACFATIAAERPIAVVRGNRDFLLDVPIDGRPCPSFSQRSRAQMLPDPSILKIGEFSTLIAHGDAWCIDDAEYMEFRLLTRSHAWQCDFLSQERAARITIAAKMRGQSKARQAYQSDLIGDVHEATVRNAVEESGLRWLVHGHTHRPAHHRWSKAGNTYHRLVLPDWDAASQRGGFVHLDVSGARTRGL